MNIKKMLQNRVVLGSICIIVAVIVCFGLTPLYNEALTQTTDVVRVSGDIGRGTKVTADKLSIVTVGGYNLPSNIIKTKDAIVGAYAAADLYAGDYIFPDKIQDEPIFGNEYLSVLDGSMLALSITIPRFSAGLSDKLEAGDIVTVFLGKVGEDKLTLLPPELSYVKILAVTDENGADLDNSYLGYTDASGTVTKKNTATVTFEVTTTQARLLVDAELNADLHVALVYRGSLDKGQKFLNKQRGILAMIDSGDILPTIIVVAKNAPVDEYREQKGEQNPTIGFVNDENNE